MQQLCNTQQVKGTPITQVYAKGDVASGGKGVIEREQTAVAERIHPCQELVQRGGT